MTGGRSPMGLRRWMVDVALAGCALVLLTAAAVLGALTLGPAMSPGGGQPPPTTTTTSRPFVIVYD